MNLSQTDAARKGRTARSANDPSARRAVVGVPVASLPPVASIVGDVEVVRDRPAASRQELPPEAQLPPMLPIMLVLLVLAALLLRAIAAAIDRLAEGCGGDRVFAVERAIARGYLNRLHRIRIEGFDEPEIREVLAGGPLLVVANHTCGLDPMLLQMPIPRRIRWMMWTGQMGIGLGWFWRHLAVLPVAQDGRDLTSVRTALRALRDGEAIGIFPEGGIERPPGVLQPFEPGLGVLASRSQAPVLLCLIEGTPAPRVFGSFVVPSRSVVRAIGVFRASPEDSAEAFRGRLAEALRTSSGWPVADATDPAGEAPR